MCTCDNGNVCTGEVRGECCGFAKLRLNASSVLLLLVCCCFVLDDDDDVVLVVVVVKELVFVLFVFCLLALLCLCHCCFVLFCFVLFCFGTIHAYTYKHTDMCNLINILCSCECYIELKSHSCRCVGILDCKRSVRWRLNWL